MYQNAMLSDTGRKVRITYYPIGLSQGLAWEVDEEQWISRSRWSQNGDGHMEITTELFALWILLKIFLLAIMEIPVKSIDECKC